MNESQHHCAWCFCRLRTQQYYSQSFVCMQSAPRTVMLEYWYCSTTHQRAHRQHSAMPVIPMTPTTRTTLGQEDAG
jgi:hypothetical protein